MGTVNIISAIRYRDCNHMIEWLKQAFDFREHAVYRGEDGTVHHAELVLGSGMIMLGTVGTNPASAGWYVQPDETGNRVTSSLYLVVNDCAAAWEKALSAGATVLMPLETKDYGGSGFTMRDPEGQVWSVGDYDPWSTPTA
jgi:uncharacterized glyoxalase superfamily protein PhnB